MTLDKFAPTLCMYPFYFAYTQFWSIFLVSRVVNFFLLSKFVHGELSFNEEVYSRGGAGLPV